MTKTEALTKARALWALIDWEMAGGIVLEGIVITAVLTYHLGLALGRWAHRTNDRLADLWVRLWVGVPAAPAEVATADPEPTDPLEDVAAAVARLEAMTCRELRELTGCRRKLAKRQLIAMAMA